MKITKQHLKQLIEEELAKTLDLEVQTETDMPEIPDIVDDPDVQSFQLVVVKKLDELMTKVDNLTTAIKH